MAARRRDVAAISAETGDGVDAARALMSAELTVRHELVHIVLRFDQGEAMAWLHARGEVLADQTEEGGHRLPVRLDAPARARFDRSVPAARVVSLPCPHAQSEARMGGEAGGST